MSKKFKSGAALTALVAMYGGVAFAQETTSSLRGEVTSEAGAPVAGASVVITHVPTGSKSETVTNDNGLFSASGLRVGGPYTVTFSAPNYRGETLEGLSLGLGQQNVITADLESADAGTDIVVTATRVRTSGTGPATALNVTDIEGVASVNRDIRDLMRRDPLVNLDPTNGNAPQIAGAHYRFNNFSIDGVNFRDEFGLNANGLPSQRSPISNDALQALTVEVAPYSAQNGNFLGGNINAVTKSGTNEFHGSAFYNWQDSFSVPARVDERPTGLVKAWDFDTYGFTLGGPILKDKLFFFGSYEWFSTPKPGTQGPDDSGAGTPAPGVTTAEMNQVIDIMRNVYGYDPGQPFRTGAETDRKMLAKIDWNINDNHRFAFTFNEVESAVPFDGSTTNATMASSNAARRLQLESYWYNRREGVKTSVGQLNSDWTENFSTELRISQKEYQVAQTSIGGQGIGAFNICAVQNNPTPYDAAATSCNNEGQILLGTDGPRQANSLSTRTDSYRIKGSYSLGDHRIDAGYELARTKVFNLFQSGAVGDYAFNSISDLQNRIASRALFAGGSRDGNGDGVIDVLDTAAIYAFKQNTAFIEDNWNVTDKLQVALGLRYDWLQSDEEPPLNPNLVTRSATYYEAQYRNIDNTKALDGLDLLQPRFSFKYDLYDNIQLRGGVGRFGATGPQVWVANSFQNNGYTSGSLNVTSAAPASPANQLPLLSNVSIIGQPALAAQLMQGTGSASSNVNLLAPDFELPSIWRASIGAQAEFDIWGNNPLRASIDFVYSQNENAAYVKNLRLTRTGTFADGRPIYAQNTSVPSLYGTTGLDLLVEQADEGESKILSVSLGQDYDNGLSWNFGYAHQDVTEISPMTSSTATSNYSNVALFDINNPTASRSLWEVENSARLEVNWTKEFVEGLETRFTFFGEHRSGLPYSYTYTGAVPTGSPRGLLYVPNFAGDTNTADTAVGPVNFSNTATLNAFRDFVLNGELAGYQGQVAPRNAFTSPDISRIDFKFSQDLPWLLNNRGHKLQFNMDIINLGNLINDEWGTIEKYPFPSAVAPITATAGAAQPDGTTGYTYSSFVNPSTIVNRCPNATVCPREGFYQIQLGVKYLF